MPSRAGRRSPSPRSPPRAATLCAGLALPAALSAGYSALILAFRSGAAGGFDRLAGVMRLFGTPGVALAGWVHYLAFDLVVGASITRTARAEGIPHLLVLPCLGLTFLVGPLGFLLFLALRAGLSLRARTPSET